MFKFLLEIALTVTVGVLFAIILPKLGVPRDYMESVGYCFFAMWAINLVRGVYSAYKG